MIMGVFLSGGGLSKLLKHDVSGWPFFPSRIIFCR